MLKQAQNDVIVEGILSQVNVRKGTSKKTGKEFISGDVIVRVNLDDGKELEVPVRMFANKLTKDGRPNPSFEDIERLLNLKSLASVDGDIERADCVVFSRADLREDSFYGRDGSFVARVDVHGSFVDTVSRKDLAPKANFDNIIVVGNIREEEDANHELTGRLVITGILPQFGGRVDKIDYIVEDPAAIKHISNNWKKGDTVRVCGLVNYTYKVSVSTEEMGFGDPIVKTSTRSVRELIIKQGSATGFDADLAYDNDEIMTALQERQARLAEMKANANTPAQQAHDKKTDFGF